jgi:hypothetical protein
MYRDIVDWATPKMSAHTSSVMFCRRYPRVHSGGLGQALMAGEGSHGRPVSAAWMASMGRMPWLRLVAR